MVLMSAELSDATGFGAIPKDWYVVEIGEVEVTESRETKAPMMNVTYVIKAGQFANKRVFPPDHIMLGGVTAKGDKQNLSRLCDLLGVAHVEWKCKGCQASGVRKFVKNEQQKYLCPDCRQETGFVYDTDDFKGKQLKVLLDQEKGFNSDEMVNRVSRVAELS